MAPAGDRGVDGRNRAEAGRNGIRVTRRDNVDRMPARPRRRCDSYGDSSDLFLLRRTGTPAR